MGKRIANSLFKIDYLQSSSLTGVEGPEASDNIVIGRAAIFQKEALRLKDLIMAGQPGNFKWHFPSITGAFSILQMKQLGWAVMDGSTVESQLVVSGFYRMEHLAITGALPDMVTTGRFVRASADGSDNVVQADALQDHMHQGDSGAPFLTANASGAVGGLSAGSTVNQRPLTAGISGGARVATETRPVNITAVPLLFCLTGYFPSIILP